MVTHPTIWDAKVGGSGIQRDYLNQKDKQARIILVERAEGWAGVEAVSVACEFNSDNSDELGALTHMASIPHSHDLK